MRILGISCYYHDSAACLLEDGRVVAAAAQERFSRKKHDNGFPKEAISFCLNWRCISARQIDAVVFYEKPILKFSRIIQQHVSAFPKGHGMFAGTIGSWLGIKLQLPKILKKEIGYTGPLYFTQHHEAHAASSYYLSGFPEAAIVTLDGVGEWATTTVGLGQGSKIRIDRETHFPNSLGLFYSALTAYLGFEVNDAEYKVMGLAAFGNPQPFRRQMNELIKQYPDGSFMLNLKYFDFVWGNHMFNAHLAELFGFPPRSPEAKMESQYKNIAAALQEKLETTVFHLLDEVYRKYKTKNLCLAGGVALNSVMNGKILSRTSFGNLYIPPDPGDAGGAIGAALAYWHRENELPSAVTFSPYLGPTYSDEQIEDVLLAYGLGYAKFSDKEKLLGNVADLLIQEKIIGWFQGRMEWGPRALGNRSILASAAKPEMKDIINTKVKHRELFRPFAPVILDTYVHDYFKADKKLSVSAKYMLMVYPFKDKGKREVPATVHVDGTGRLQVIERADNPMYYDLIDIYRKKTGTPIIINTSFNIRGEPIVCTPEDAVACFLGTEIDYLVIGSFLVRKNDHV